MSRVPFVEWVSDAQVRRQTADSTSSPEDGEEKQWVSI